MKITVEVDFEALALALVGMTAELGLLVEPGDVDGFVQKIEEVRSAKALSDALVAATGDSRFAMPIPIVDKYGPNEKATQQVITNWADGAADARDEFLAKHNEQTMVGSNLSGLIHEMIKS
jgi:hypothetical protein